MEISNAAGGRGRHEARRHDGNAGKAGRLLRHRGVFAPDLDRLGRGASVVRPRPRVGLRLQPRGVAALLSPGRRGGPRLRHGALGRRLCGGTLLQPPVGAARRDRAAGTAQGDPRRGPAGALPPRPGDRGGTGPRGGDGGPLPLGPGAPRLHGVDGGLRGRHARGPPRVSGRSGHLRAPRRRPHVAHSLEALGPRDRRASRVVSLDLGRRCLSSRRAGGSRPRGQRR